MLRTALPWLLLPLLTILILLPVAFTFLGAVMSGALADPEAHFTLAKIAAVYATLPFLRLLATTLATAGLVASLATLGGVAFAWLLSRTDLPGRTALETGVIAPLFISPFVGAIAWLVIASPRAGLVNVLAAHWFGTTTPLINIATQTGIVAVMALYFLPYAYLTAAAALRQSDPALEEAARLGGTGPLATAWRITLPMVRPALISAFFFVFVLACGTFAIPAVLDRSGKVHLLAVAILQANATYPIDFGTAAAIATLLFWVSLLGITAYRFAARAAGRFVAVTGRGQRARRLRLGAWRWPLAGLVGTYILLAIALPLLALLWSGFTRPGSLPFAPAWTLQNAARILDAPEVADATRNTLLVGLAAPSLCVALGLLVAYAVRRLNIAGAKWLDRITMFSIAIPGIVLGTGLFWTWVLTPLHGTIAVLILAFLAAYLPFAYRISDTALLQIDRTLEEASLLCGAGPTRTLARITLPLTRPALLSAWIIVFIFAVREISVVVLLTSADNTLLSALSFNYLTYGNVPKAALIGLLQTTILAAGVLTGRYILRVRVAGAG